MALVTIARPGRADETLPRVARFEAEDEDVEDFDDDGEWDALDDPDELDEDDLDDWDDDFDEDELVEENPATDEDGGEK